MKATRRQHWGGNSPAFAAGLLSLLEICKPRTRSSATRWWQNWEGDSPGEKKKNAIVVLDRSLRLRVACAIGLSPCHRTPSLCLLTPATAAVPLACVAPFCFARSISLSPSLCAAHPSRCQAACPRRPHLSLRGRGPPSNNFISFPPLSRWHAHPLTIGCCFLAEREHERERQSVRETEGKRERDGESEEGQKGTRSAQGRLRTQQ